MVSKAEQKIVRQIVKAGLAKGWSVTMNNGGEEDEFVNSRDEAAIMAEMFATDEETITFRENGYHIGSVYFVYGNEPDEVVNDYSVKLEDFMKECDQ